MGVKLMKSVSTFSFHIDAVLLSQTISDMAALTKIASQSENPEAFLKMNVTVFRNGCFQIDFSTVCEVASGLIFGTSSIVNFAHSVIEIVKDYFEIKKFLKGESPKRITEKGTDSVEIESKDGNTILVSKSGSAIVNNYHIDNLVVNIANHVSDHNPNGGFSFNTEDEQIHYSAQDIKEMAKSMPIIETCKKQQFDVDLIIKTADFVGHSQWEFRLNNRNIRASILDNDFLDRIHNGLSIKYYDSIRARLEVSVNLDNNGSPIEGSERYTVIKVYGDIIHSNDTDQQMKFNL